MAVQALVKSLGHPLSGHIRYSALFGVQNLRFMKASEF